MTAANETFYYFWLTILTIVRVAISSKISNKFLDVLCKRSNEQKEVTIIGLAVLLNHTIIMIDDCFYFVVSK